ncbi:SDR family NAD(P)-dependent oxidoreductase [Escherichia coli]|uniref:SDR family NAD(P)-dependent oxidoreductase n=1 Tax=Escherichia coli TaxID=562 RepID=A0A895NX29_ECOLX|nr:SDR family NAD(P)-dependent oxidoreductase [Escherichia coli]EFL9862502.1 SDR family NAD(P)-dependent oxidoreductase [Escherichia coli]EFU8276128.1 SDR family NAD(P)-dependent oxidoreductase [Escherichia coli]EGI4684120.1 SDR family NAD(P)-dependent oxidoreductase [Escherichia coli]EGP9751316.1 SDR family NAD(P)-dependent oxidoreductase [Escherichia coli]
MRRGSRGGVRAGTDFFVQESPGQTGYAATRAALTGIMHSLVHQVSRFGIRINTAAPGAYGIMFW